MRPEKQPTSLTILLPFLVEVFTSAKREKEMSATRFSDCWLITSRFELEHNRRRKLVVRLYDHCAGQDIVGGAALSVDERVNEAEAEVRSDRMRAINC